MNSAWIKINILALLSLLRFPDSMRARGRDLFWLWLTAIQVLSVVDSIAATEQIYRPNYDCVDDAGTFTRIFKIGTIESETAEYPFVLMFSPVKTLENTLLGPGWRIPIFDCTIFQASDNEFAASLPNGEAIVLARSKKEQNVLVHPSGWRGEVGQNYITIRSPVGFGYTYKAGLLSTIETPSREVLSITRSRELTQLVSSSNRRVLLSINPLKASDGSLTARVGGQEILLSLTKRPIIRSVGEQRLINSMVPALKDVVVDGLPRLSANYEVSPELLPLAQFFDGDNNPLSNSCWHPDTGAIIRENGWDYAFKRPSTQSSYQITRTSEQGLTESSTYDPAQALSRRVDALGRAAIFSEYPHALMVNASRKISVIRDGKEDVFYRSCIDDQGQLLRETTQSSEGPIQTRYEYSAREGDFDKIVTRNDKTLLKETYKGRTLISTTAGQWSVTRNAKGEVSISQEPPQEVQTITNKNK